jgi:hypothetical protein
MADTVAKPPPPTGSPANPELSSPVTETPTTQSLASATLKSGAHLVSGVLTSVGTTVGSVGNAGTLAINVSEVFNVSSVVVHVLPCVV